MSNISNHNSRFKKNIAFYLSVAAIVLAVALMILIICAVIFSADTQNEKIDSSVISSSDSGSSQPEVSSESSSGETSQENNSSLVSSENNDASSQNTTDNKTNLDPDFTRLLLVNDANPLPADYDYEGNLVTVDKKYINGSLRQVDKDVWPYMQAMLEAAWADGVKLYIWSPYRSYNTQKMLFENKISRVTQSTGLTGEAAEIEAAKVVARPGTSEHHTGLAADFNMANNSFETTDMFRWMKENAENYGFIMRYSEEKHDITKIIHESWHWRFVGINVAKEMNSLNMCLEEYVKYKGIENNSVSE